MNKTDIVGHIVNSIQFTPLNLKNSSLYDLVKNISMCNTDDLCSFWTWVWFTFCIFWTMRWFECINFFGSRPNVWKGIFSTKKTKWVLPLKLKTWVRGSLNPNIWFFRFCFCFCFFVIFYLLCLSHVSFVLGQTVNFHIITSLYFCLEFDKVSVFVHVYLF